MEEAPDSKISIMIISIRSLAFVKRDINYWDEIATEKFLIWPGVLNKQLRNKKKYIFFLSYLDIKKINNVLHLNDTFFEF